MSLVGVGLTLQPDHVFLDLLDGLVREGVDYYEVTPETLWAEAPGGFVPNVFHARLRELQADTGKPVVAHGVALSPGSARDELLDEPAWRAAHLRQLARDAEVFDFLWLTDHAGASVLAGQNVSMPLPVPMTEHAARLLGRRLNELRAIVPDVGLENTCHYFLPGDPLHEPRFLSRALAAADSHLLLDLHNLWTMALNLDFDPHAYLAELDLDRVIELHVSGGADSDPRWLPDGATLRLDGHDGAVPEPVFALLEAVVPRCRNLRGVTLERMEGTIDMRSVAGLADELARIREVLGGMTQAEQHADYERILADALRAEDPVVSVRTAAKSAPAPLCSWLLAACARPAGLRISALLCARLRFERLVQGDAAAAACFAEDPAAFARAFHRYHREVAPTAHGPRAESALYTAWRASHAG